MCEDCERPSAHWQRERDELREQVSSLKEANSVSSIIIGVGFFAWYLWAAIWR